MVTQAPNAPFAELIRDARTDKGLTQTQLAEIVGCPQQTIEKIELGKTKRSGYLPEIFSALGLDLGLLANRTEIAIGKATLPSVAKKHAPRVIYVAGWRKHRHIDVRIAAAAAKVDPDHYQFLETRPHKFTVEQLEDLATAFEISFTQMWFKPQKDEPISPAPAAKKQARK